MLILYHIDEIIQEIKNKIRDYHTNYDGAARNYSGHKIWAGNFKSYLSIHPKDIGGTMGLWNVRSFQEKVNTYSWNQKRDGDYLFKKIFYSLSHDVKRSYQSDICLGFPEMFSHLYDDNPPSPKLYDGAIIHNIKLNYWSNDQVQKLRAAMTTFYWRVGTLMKHLDALVDYDYDIQVVKD
jgi:hypothetical protein